MKYLLGIFFILMISQVYAACESGQIDINSASAEKLDELYGIGPVKAEAIINSRPFESVDDLINVSGIGEITLQKIKEQGLACVEDDDEEPEEEIGEEKEEDISREYEEIGPKQKVINYNYTIPDASPVIKLNAQTIKSGDGKEKLDKNKYAGYGFVAFCILLAFLFVLKLRKDKNEFEE